MKRFISCILLLGVALAVNMATVQAASVMPLLKNGPNAWEDDDFETLVFDSPGPTFFTPGNGVIDVGDRFLGVLRMQNINGTNLGTGDPTLTAVFYLEAESVTYRIGNSTVGATQANATNVTITFQPIQITGGDAAIAGWTALDTFLGGGVLPIPTHDSTMAILFDHPNIATAVETGGIPNSIKSFWTTATKLTEFGFMGLPNEAWLTRGEMNFDDVNTSAVEDLDTDEPADLLGLIGAGANPSNQIAINVTANFSSLVYSNTNALISSRPAQLQGAGNFDATAAGSWPIKTDTNLATNLFIPIPEPGSLAIFSILSLSGLAISRRRSRKA